VKVQKVELRVSFVEDEPQLALSDVLTILELWAQNGRLRHLNVIFVTDRYAMERFLHAVGKTDNIPRASICSRKIGPELFQSYLETL